MLHCHLPFATLQRVSWKKEEARAVADTIKGEDNESSEEYTVVGEKMDIREERRM